MSQQRELVGDLDRSAEYNEGRHEGDESTEGMADRFIDDILGGEGDGGEGEQPRQSVRIRADPTRFVLRDPPDGVDELLYDTIAYEDPDARWTPAYKRGRWDGVERLYDRDEHAASIGLLPRATDALDSEGYPFAVTDNRDYTGEPIDPEWKFPHDLRDYQREAVRSVVDAGGGLVSLPTGSGKTVVALRTILELGRSAVVFVHSQELLYQWAGRGRDVLGVDPGVIGDGEWSEGPVTVAVMQTLLSRGTDDLGEYDVAIFDEAHKTSAAETFHEAGQAVDAPVRVGLSATPWRSTSGEEMKIEGAVGGLAYEVDAETLIEAGHLARPEWSVIDPADYGGQATANPGEEWNGAYQRCVVECEARNRAVADTAASLASDDRRVLVSVSRLEHGERLTDRLADSHDVPAEFLCGSDSTDRRQDVLEAFGTGDLDVLVSTLVREGVDIPAINAVVLAGGGKSKTEKIQTIGRALRPENGTTADVVDVRDRGEYLEDHFEQRMAAYGSYYGQYGPEEGQDVARVRDWLKQRLATSDLSADALSVSKDPDRDRIIIEPDEYLGDRWDDFVAVMQSADAIRYDAGEQTNYVRDPDRLPERETVVA